MSEKILGVNKVYKSKNFFVRNLPIILAFFLTTLALAIMFAAKGMYPFGESMYLRSDMYHQYATFLKQFQTILKTGGSLEYTWNIGLGSEFVSTYAYYLASPANWLVALLPSTNIPEIMGGFIIIKAGLMSATFTFYVQEHYHKRNFLAAAFGIFYGMSSYMAAYSWNLMWIDCLLLLPLIILGLERLVHKKKVILYTVTLALAVLSNYYIAIMIAIFLVLYFLYLIICEFRPGGFKNLLGKIGRFALYSILAGLIALAVVLPAYLLLSSTASGNMNFPKKLTAYFNFLEMVAHGVMNIEATVLSGYIPNIYCTVGLFMFIPLYWISTKVKLAPKIGKTVLMFIMLLSFEFNIPTYIWHGFHFPNSLSSRESFLYIFLVLVMAYEVILKIRTFKYVEIFGCFAAGTIAIYGLQALYGSEDFTVLVASISVGFLALYVIWAALMKSSKVAPVVMIIALLGVAVAEASINTSVTGYPTTNRTSYVTDNESISELLESIEDDGFYRVEKVTRRTKNDGAWSDYMSASEFSSTTLEGISDFYDSFGMQSSTNSFSYYGHTPLSTAILGVKYELSKTELDDELKTLKNTSGEVYLYENKYAFSIGFMVSENITNATMDSENPFVVQNSFTQCAGAGALFDVGESYSGSAVTFNVENNGRQYIFITDKLKSATVTIVRDGSVFYSNEFTSLENPQIIDLGDVRSDDQITIVSTDEDVTNITVKTAQIRYSTLNSVMSALGKNQLEVSDFEDTYIKGTVTAEESQVLFTSIPYYDGWEVYVDGEKTEIESFNDAFIMLRLSKGEHTIEFKYTSPNLRLGILISILAILVFVFLRIMVSMGRKRRRVKKSRRPEKNNAAAEPEKLYETLGVSWSSDVIENDKEE